MKRVLKIVGIFLVAILITGCMSMNMAIKINEDKSVDLNMKMEINLLEYARNITSMNPDSSGNLTDEELKKYVDENFNIEDEDFMDEEELKELESAGYKVEKNYDKEKYIYQIILTKHANNIDDISKLENDSKNDEQLIFIKTSKNTYKPNINLISETTPNDTNETTPDTTNDISSMLSSGMAASISYIYEISLPDKPISHNATSVSSDGKTLFWTLNGNSQTSIDFEFAFPEPKKDDEVKNDTKTQSSGSNNIFTDFFKDMNNEKILALGLIVGGSVTIVVAILAYVISNRKNK